MTTKLRLLIMTVLLTAFVVPATGCATSGKGRNERHAQKVRKKSSGPKNYSLYKGKDIDRNILRRGQRTMYAPALDSY